MFFCDYGVAATSRLLKIIGLFRKETFKRGYSAKETYNFKEPANRSHPIVSLSLSYIYSYIQTYILTCLVTENTD